MDNFDVFGDLGDLGGGGHSPGRGAPGAGGGGRAMPDLTMEFPEPTTASLGVLEVPMDVVLANKTHTTASRPYNLAAGTAAARPSHRGGGSGSSNRWAKTPAAKAATSSSSSRNSAAAATQKRARGRGSSAAAKKSARAQAQYVHKRGEECLPPSTTNPNLCVPMMGSPALRLHPFTSAGRPARRTLRCR